jgi:hypothetical protein
MTTYDLVIFLYLVSLFAIIYIGLCASVIKTIDAFLDVALKSK